jgi:hypothetical protein
MCCSHQSGSWCGDRAALNTLSVIDQSSSVIPVSMAGSLLPDTHRFEEKVIREYPYVILARRSGEEVRDKPLKR